MKWDMTHLELLARNIDMLTFDNFMQLRKMVFGEIEKLRQQKLVGNSLDCGVIIPQWIADELKENFGWGLDTYENPSDPTDNIADMLTVSIVKTHPGKKEIQVFSIPETMKNNS